MLRLTLTLIPGGDEARAEELGRITIANESGLADVSDYSVRLTGKRGIGMATVRHARVGSPWSLVAKALAAVGWRA